jgi:hypothetical protein
MRGREDPGSCLYSGAALLLVTLLASMSAGSSPARAEGRSPCSLLTNDEVEAIIGTKLAGPGFRSKDGKPAARGDICRYETPEFRSIGVRVEWSNGGDLIGAMNLFGSVAADAGLKGALKLSDGTELTGAWDEARIYQCCEFNALRGEQLVVIDIAGSRASLTQAAALADVAIRRLDRPLAVNDAASMTSAEERSTARPRKRSACELVSRTEAEAIVGGALSAEPAENEKSGRSICTYAWKPPEQTSIEYELNLEVTWRDGFNEFRTTQAAIGNTLDYIKQSERMDLRTAQTRSEVVDEKASSIVGVMGVRRDVLLTIDNGGFSEDIAGAFIEKAASHL